MKKFMALLLVAVGLATMLSGPVSAAESYQNKNITRAELAKMIALELAKFSGETDFSAYSGCFADVESNTWYEGYVCYLALKGLVDGYADGQFKPFNSVTRAEGLKAIMMIYEYVKGPTSFSSNQPHPYSDVAEKDAWFYGWVKTAAFLGVTDIKPFVGKHFFPSKLLNVGRAELMINKLDKVLID